MFLKRVIGLFTAISLIGIIAGFLVVNTNKTNIKTLKSDYFSNMENNTYNIEIISESDITTTAGEKLENNTSSTSVYDGFLPSVPMIEDDVVVNEQNKDIILPNDGFGTEVPM